MRTIWKGSLVFGRIAIPVGLAPTFAKGEIALSNLCREHETPVSAPRWCEQHERALVPEEMVKAHEISPGQFITLEEDELAAIAPDAEARTIEIFGFVPRSELEPLLQGKGSYYLAPGAQELMRRAYGLLSAAMRETDTVGLARLVAWRAEHLCTIERTAERTLVLRMLRFPEDFEPADELEELLVDAGPAEDEQELACELIGQLSRPLAKLDLVDHGRERLRALIETKLAGGELVRAKPQHAKPALVAPADLAGALRASLKKRRPQAARSKSRSNSRASARS